MAEEALLRMIRRFKVVVFLACLLPLASLGWKGYNGLLGANPIEVITHSTGDCALIFLLITLALTPLRKLAGQLWLIRFRRMFGLFAFFYVVLHFLTYIWLDKVFDVHEVLTDVTKRRFITVGFFGFVLLIPLAITSTSGWIRRLGGAAAGPVASTDLCQRSRGCDPLLVAGQGGHSQAARVRVCAGIVAVLPRGGLGVSRDPARERTGLRARPGGCFCESEGLAL
jgi:Ferric reductase like transmembrane component